MLDRRPEQAYAKAQSFDYQTVERSLSAIDRETLEGKRDYALLCVAFTTGRKRAELASLRGR